MTFYNNFQNLNMSYISNGLNNWFTPSFGMFNQFMPFNWNMPSLFNFDLMPFNFSQMFSWNSPIWNNSFVSFTAPDINLNRNNNIFSGSNFYSAPQIGDTFSRTSTNVKINSSIKMNLVERAKSYVGKVNSDSEGNRLFSRGLNQPWCADFVSYNLKQTYGNRLPSFTHFSSVNGLREWGEKNGCYRKVPSSGKASYIAQNIKPGDIMIEKNGGKSHTGIVTKVNSDGSFETVEGNCSNKVAVQRYNADSPTLSGFISLDKYTA